MEPTILMIDDHAIFLAHARRYVERAAAVRVVGQSQTAREGIDLARRLQPGVILLDVSIGDECGLDAIEPLMEVAPAARIFMLSSHCHGAVRSEAFRRGARAFVSKDRLTDNAFLELLFSLDGEESAEFGSPSLGEHRPPSRESGSGRPL